MLFPGPFNLIGAFDRFFTEKKNAANDNALRSIVFELS